MVTEFAVAQAIASGDLPSPTEFYNSSFWSIRITGTGVMWRGEPVNEFCYRDPAIWLTGEMSARCAGLPVLMDHPPKGTLNSQEFAARCVGMVMIAFVRDAELWAVARILDKAAAAIFAEGCDTSPGVQFEAGSGAFLDIEGKRMFVEPTPCLVDHIAACERGRWTRDGPPGVEITEEANETSNMEPRE